MIFNGPGFLAVVIRLLANPLPPFPVSKLDRQHRKAKEEGQLADGRRGEGEGEEPNHTAARKPGPL
jgi:hypothetical protein